MLRYTSAAGDRQVVGSRPWMLEAAIVLELVLQKFTEAAIIAGSWYSMRRWFLPGRKSSSNAGGIEGTSRLECVGQAGWHVEDRAIATWCPAILSSCRWCSGRRDVKIVDGSVLLDQSMLTGESVPTEAGAGAQTYAGALVRAAKPPRR